MTETLVQIALRELEATTCLCGKKKKSRQSFCFACFKALPQKLQRELYKSISDGYAEVYSEAKDYLRQVVY